MQVHSSENALNNSIPIKLLLLLILLLIHWKDESYTWDNDYHKMTISAWTSIFQTSSSLLTLQSMSPLK